MAKEDRIEDLPSYRELSEKVKGLEALGALWPILKRFRLVKDDIPDLESTLTALKARSQTIFTLPDRFNDAFAARGWIAYESLNLDLIRRAAEYAEAGDVERGEQEILDYYRTEKNLRFHLVVMNGVRSWRPRAALAEKAKQDYLEGRYHAVVPVVLALMDGFVSDIATTGFFAQGTDTEAWDSIAGHSSGLKVLCDIFNKGRRKTTEETIDQPYRHGIMHGRDLGYDNVVVATKCWAALFAVRDWAAKYEANPEPEERTPKKESFIESLRALAEAGARLKKNEEVKAQLAEWAPRPILESPGEVDAFEEGSPEELAATILELWSRGNYGDIAQNISSLSGNETISKAAGRIRSQIEPKRFDEYSILAVVDQAAAITVVVARVVGQSSYALEPEEQFFGLRMIYEDEDGSPVVRGRLEGTWKIVEGSLYTPSPRDMLLKDAQS